MKIIKKINNNVALALDGNGNEMVVFGKGVGFPEMPYILEDMSRIQRTFYGVNPKYQTLAMELPEEYLLVSGEIVEQAQMELDCQLNPNLPFTLADHLNFAAERLKQGLEIQTPLAYDVEHLYPKETRLGKMALDKMEKRMGVRLPDSEIISIAMHLINAETEVGDMHSTLLMTQIVTDTIQIVQDEMGVELVKEGFNYFRFVSHIRYLAQRMMQNKQIDSENTEIYESARLNYPQSYRCAEHIRDYFKKKWNWKCSDEEMLYLMMHINRVCSERI